MIRMTRSAMRRLHGPVYTSRLHALVRAIVPHVRAGDRVLDVGCGFGALGQAIMAAPACPEGVTVEGLERVRRDDELIPITAYDGMTMPLEDDAVDVVIVADVLHHDDDPDRVLAECRRVARRTIIVKDHVRQGWLAQSRLSLIDWAANAPYGVPCLYRYSSLDEWRAVPKRHDVVLEHEVATMDLYPRGVNALFGRRLQYLAVYGVAPAS